MRAKFYNTLLVLTLWAIPNISMAACIGWNCDGKNPCTGMGCKGDATTGSSPSKNTPGPLNKPGTGSGTNSSGTSTTNSSNSQTPNSAPKKKPPPLPDVEGLQGQTNQEGWNGERYEDSHP